MLSLVLPATDQKFGWFCALDSYLFLFSVSGWFAVIASPGLVILLICPFFNAIVLLAPWIAGQNPERASSISAFLCPAVLVPLFLPREVTGDVQIGYYVWLLSFLGMAVGCWWLEKSWTDD